MITHRCKRCAWWDAGHVSVKLIPKIDGKSTVGFCRKHKPGVIQLKNHFYGVQPVMDAEEFCGEFREDKGD
jgi:hypothetical protein